jgi:putative Mg2+ transporter-C (MgtC) family protein
MPDLTELGAAVLRLVCALAAGGILGWERELRDKPAGLRTNMIVALGAALLVLVGLRINGPAPANDQLHADLSRIIQGIIGGIGFLGAGTIIQSRHDVHGLTTASTLWLSAALGISSGLGYYALTLAAVILALLVLVMLGALQVRLMQHTDTQPRPGQPSGAHADSAAPEAVRPADGSRADDQCRNADTAG